MASLKSRFDELAARPPAWMRIIIVPLFVLVALGVADRRGWLAGAVAAVVYGGLGLAMALNPDGTVAWSRQHPLLDGAILGPLVFLALAYLTHLPLWVCVIIGLAGVALGAARGAQRARYRARQSSRGRSRNGM